MSTPGQRAALSALQSARPTVDRLNLARHPDDVAADVIETWSAVETALRSLLGGSSLSGLALVRELSARQQLTLAQANALAEFSAARDRATHTPYTPGPNDVEAARNGFNALYNGLAAEVNATVPGAATRAVAPAPAVVAASAPVARERSRLVPAIAGALALLAL
ncbi:MAG TPA: hypothetical protein VNA89_06650, partial [Gemmatimonadaceae bacterium]|nr:hypothetical protein [Gemmatimonadaceae bacterium]